MTSDSLVRTPSFPSLLYQASPPPPSPTGPHSPLCGSPEIYLAALCPPWIVAPPLWEVLFTFKRPPQGCGAWFDSEGVWAHAPLSSHGYCWRPCLCYLSRWAILCIFIITVRQQWWNRRRKPPSFKNSKYLITENFCHIHTLFCTLIPKLCLECLRVPRAASGDRDLVNRQKHLCT